MARFCLGLGFCFIMVTQLFAEEIHQNPPITGDFRELCRSAVAGMYLSEQDGLRREEDLAISLRKALAKIDLQLARTKDSMTKARALYEKESFDIKTQDQLLGAEHAFSSLNEQKALNRRLLQESTLRIEQYKAQAEKIKRALPPVFILAQPQKEDRSTGYRFRVHYASPCPAYETVCPLPPKHRKALAQMLPGLLPEACTKYSSIGGT